jgi:hypothetical protein
MHIDSAITIMEAYGEVDDRVKEFGKTLEEIIIKPRFELKSGILPSISIQGVSCAIAL